LWAILRTAAFDEKVKDFLGRHPEGTVIEIGAGLNTRFERLDNGRVHWFDLDLPDAVELRRRFFSDSERRATLAGSVANPGWLEAVRRSPGPYCFVAEAVFIYLTEQEVKTALTQIAGNFPGASIAFDTASPAALERGNQDHAGRKLEAHFTWSCDDPRKIEDWKIGWHLVQSRTLMTAPDALRQRLSWRARTVLRVFAKLFPAQMNAYRLNLFSAQA